MEKTQNQERINAYWCLEIPDLLKILGSSADGISSQDAQSRLNKYGPNILKEHKSLSRLGVLWAQLRSPLLLLLIFASALSAVTQEWVDSAIVLSIVFATVGIGYFREYSAQSAVEALQEKIRVKAKVIRDNQSCEIPVADVVPGDVVLLGAGSLIPADGVVLESSDCYVTEAVLTGESFPVEKTPGKLPAESTLSKRSNCIFLGTNVRSGTARCLIVATGHETQFGAIAHRLTLRPPETEFDRGIRRFGYLLTVSMLIMILLVFVAHVLQGRPPIETLLFSIALAVGLSPELLPAILSVSLSRGAQMMAAKGVLVRRLNAIENLGSMDVLCTDKTGTLTEGVISMEGAYNSSGDRSSEVLELAAKNAGLQGGLTNALDEAILRTKTPALEGIRKLAEIPFDFTRKRVSVIVQMNGKVLLITKGAFHHVLEICTRNHENKFLDAAAKDKLEALYTAWGNNGIRVIALGMREIESRSSYSRSDEKDLSFEGFVTFMDRPKEDAREVIADFARLGVSLKVITGDNKLVAQHVAKMVGLRADRTLTGSDLDNLHDEALWRLAEDTDIFAEVDPNQKERIILSLKKMGHVVGFLGDGINDAPAMHAADTSLSVESAADVARDAADFVLLQKHLDVVRGGIEEGRKTFANTMKYILITTSANLGNMVSMAVASLFLPFLPLLAGQILLNNFLSDVPAVGIADDSVDEELVKQPRRWDIRFIGRFMIFFGLASSLFDFLTFGMLLGVFRAGVSEFRTAWFIESLLTELVIALVVRTRRPFYKSRPGRFLFHSTLVLIVLTFAIPFLPFLGILGFVRLPLTLLLALIAITILYVCVAEILKKYFYRREQPA